MRRDKKGREIFPQVQLRRGLMTEFKELNAERYLLVSGFCLISSLYSSAIKIRCVVLRCKAVFVPIALTLNS